MDAKDKKIATDLCYEIIKEVGELLDHMLENLNLEKKLKWELNGTPTSYIDVIAEDQG